MYEKALEMTKNSFKPMVQLAESNTALAVKLISRQSEKAVKMLEDNLAHVQALSAAEDFNGAVELQQKYVEAKAEEAMASARENAADIEEAVTEAGKILEGSWAEVQTQVKEAADVVKTEVKKAATKKAA